MVVFLQSRLGLVLPAVLGLFAILTRWLVCRTYRHIALQAEKMDTTKDKYLKYWKIQFEEMTGTRKGVTSIPSYVDKSLEKYRKLGITLKQWDTLADGWVLLTMLVGLLLAFGAYWYELDGRLLILYGAAGVVFAGVALLVSAVLNPSGKKEKARFSLMDYLEYTLLPELEGRPGQKRNRVQPLQSPKLTLEPEEEAVLKDVFQEFLM